MNISKLIFKSDKKLNIFLPQTSNYQNINYLPQELDLKKEIDINLNGLKNCDNKKIKKIIEIIKQKNIKTIWLKNWILILKKKK